MIHVFISYIILLIAVFIISISFPIILTGATFSMILLGMIGDSTFGWVLYFIIPGVIMLGTMSILLLNIFNIISKKIYLSLCMALLVVLIFSYWFIKSGYKITAEIIETFVF